LRLPFPKIKALRRSNRSTIAPIGIAKNSQGSNPRADSAPIKIGSWVSETARSGAARRRTPSTRLVIRLADQIRVKSCPRGRI